MSSSSELNQEKQRREFDDGDDVEILPEKQANDHNTSNKNEESKKEEEEVASPKIVIGPAGSVNSTNTLSKKSQIIHHHPKGAVPESTGIWKTLDEYLIQKNWLSSATAGDAQDQDQDQTNEREQQQPTETVKSILSDVGPSTLKAASTQILMYANQALAVIFVSHLLGTEKLAPFGVAISFFNVCSASIIVGMSVAMETLASQAFGHDPKGPGVGEHVQFNLSIVYLLAVPLALFFSNSHSAVVFLFGTDMAEDIAEFLSAGPIYLYMFATRAVVNRALLASKRAHIPLYGMFVSVCLFPFIAYYLIPRGLYYAGIALSISAGIHLTAMIVLAYFDKESFIHFVSWNPLNITKLWTKERFTVFMSLAVPTAGTVLLSWWVQEALVWIGARMTVDRVAALSIILNLTTIMFVTMIGFGTAMASVIGNRLGANEPMNARACAQVLFVLGLGICLFNALFALIFGKLIFRLYTHEETVLDHLHSVLPLICLFHIVEGTAMFMSGVFRGGGEQKSLLPVQFFSMWTFAVPLMYVLTVVYEYNIFGLMIGFMCGFCVQIPWCLKIMRGWNWRKLAENAAERRKNQQKQEEQQQQKTDTCDGKNLRSAEAVKKTVVEVDEQNDDKEMNDGAEGK